MPAGPLTWSPRWAVESSAAGRLVVSAGADRLVAVDGVSDDQLATAVSWARGSVITAGRDPSLAALRDRLVEIGAVVAAFPQPPDVDIVGTGSAVARLAASLSTMWPTNPGGVDAAIALVVRTTQEWPELPMNRTHIGLDLTMHHTVLIGPLVLPGATTCVRCMQTRSARRWGSPAVAAEPGASSLIPAIAALVDVQLELVLAGTSPLVNATIAWDFAQGTVDRQKVYKLPGCTTCEAAPHDGRVSLPWTA